MDEAELWRVPVTYGAIGATQAADLLRYPPKGYRPIERRVRIGHGVRRWEFAWTEALSWGIQRRAGIRVTALDSPAEVVEATYTPVAFDDDGVPARPAMTGEAEHLFAADGSPMLRPGDLVIMRIALWPFPVPARVVYVIDEPDRKGFAYGTLPGHPERGEEAFVVEHRADDSVWLVIRAFSRPANPLLRVGYPVLRLVQAVYTSRYERALTAPLEGD